jgi:phosphoribosylformylglycinamidine synthase
MRIGVLDVSPAGGAARWSALAGHGGAPGSTFVPIDRDASSVPACEAIVVTGARAFQEAAGERSGGDGAMLLAAGAIAEFAEEGGPVLGVGGGFEILRRAGLLPGAIVDGAADDPAASVYLRVEGRPTPFTSAIPAGRVMRLAASGAGGARYAVDDLPALEAAGQVVLRRCDAGGGLGRHAAPASIAGICNRRGNVVAVLLDDIAADAAAALLESLRLHVALGARRRR